MNNFIISNEFPSPKHWVPYVWGGECFSLISDLQRESEKMILLQSQTLLTLLQGHLCDCRLSPHSPLPPHPHIGINIILVLHLTSSSGQEEKKLRSKVRKVWPLNRVRKNDSGLKSDIADSTPRSLIISPLPTHWNKYCLCVTSDLVLRSGKTNSVPKSRDADCAPMSFDDS